MKRIAWVLTAVIGTWGCGGGGGGGTGGDPNPPTVTYYSDVTGYGVEPGAEKVDVRQWPSWLREKGLVPACNAGEISYADECWQTMVVDVDAGSVTFHKAGADRVLALGEPVPSALGTLVGDPDGCWSTIDGWSCFWPHHGDSGYVGMAGPYAPGTGYASEDVWDSPVVAYDLGRPSRRSPWAIGNQLDVKDGEVAGFLVKTTQLYGFKTTKPSPGPADYAIVHNWAYAGGVRLMGQTLPLPVKLADVAAVSGASIGRAVDGSAYLDLFGSTVRLMSDRNVIAARRTFGATGAGLSDDGLVTSIEFSAAALQSP